MMTDDLLSDGARALFKLTADLLPASGIGIVKDDRAGQAVLTYADAGGVTAYRLSESDTADALLPLDQIVTQPVRDGDLSATLIVGLTRSIAPASAPQPALETLAREATVYLRPRLSAERELALLRRLDAVADLASALFGVRDIRGMVERLGATTREVLRHDVTSLGLFSADLERMEVYTYDSKGVSFTADERPPYSVVTTRAWLYGLCDGSTVLRGEGSHQSAPAGSAIRLALRNGEIVLGVLNFISQQGDPYTAEDLAVGQRIANDVATALRHFQALEDVRRAEEFRQRGANLELLDGLLHTLSGVLDIREVFDRVSAIAQKVLPHDALSIAEVVNEGRDVRVHASSGLANLPQPFDYPAPDPEMVSEPWEVRLIADVQQLPRFSQHPATVAGMRAMMFVAIRFEGRLFGGLNFYSKTVGRYGQADLLLARRITDHVALAISHQRLAEQARRNEELRARAENLELLDELLASLIDTGELPDVFERISAIARKVLPHDALGLPVLLPDGRHARRYASSGLTTVGVPDIIGMPEEVLRPDWEYDLINDLPAHSEEHNVRAARMGFGSALRVPIRLDARFAGMLAFLSKAQGAFTQADVVVARRIADRMAVTLARDREIQASRRADEASERAARLESRVRALTDELDARTGFRRVVGESKQWRHVLTQATQVAATETTVLLLGESGTGKEVVARFLHRASSRAKGPFIALNCAALPEQLLEAELFGYERGAYTGATQSKPGQLEQAAGGTLFLDEVGEMSPSAQAKFLRVLQEKEFQRLGGTRVLRTDARIVAATNRDLARAITQGQFREDLYYRLNVFAIHLPALRDRPDDVLPLSEAFLAEISKGLGRPPAGISRDARKRLSEYPWPGNVRELRNILERAAILCEGGLITADHLGLTVTAASRSIPQADQVSFVAAASSSPGAPAPRPASANDLQSLERNMIEDALQAARFNKSKAAKALGLTRQQLYVRMRKYGLE